MASPTAVYREALRVARLAPTAILRRKMSKNIKDLCSQFRSSPRALSDPGHLAECEQGTNQPCRCHVREPLLRFRFLRPKARAHAEGAVRS